MPTRSKSKISLQWTQKNPCNKFHSIAALNDLIANLDGSIGGTRHGNPTLAESWFKDQMQLHCNDSNGHPFSVYVDAAYPLRAHFRSSHQRCSIKKGVLRNFPKFIGKHLCQSLFFNSCKECHFIKKRDSGTKVFL